MFTHIAKLIWNRKRSNLLIISEVAIAFAVLFAIISAGIHNYRIYNIPLGFEWENSWNIQLDTGGQWKNETDKVTLKSMVDILQNHRKIESASVMMMPFFENSRWRSGQKINGKDATFLANRIDSKGPDNLGVKLLDGRWFGPQDNDESFVYIMVNQRFADEYLNGADPVDFVFSDPDAPEATPRKIVGVFEDFRQQGEFSSPTPYAFFRYDFDAGYAHGINNIVIKFKQEESASFEAELMKLLKDVAPTWEFTIVPLKTKRDSQVNQVIIPLTVLAVIVAFLMLMVAMGLFGVLWQNISRRTQEIGLRRALGASESSVKGQIIGELVVLALFGILIATIFIVQIPLLQLIDSVSWPNFAMSMSLAVLVMLLIVVLCALYPSRAAIKLPPSVALHYE